MEQWYVEHGQAIFDETRELSRESRYQRLGEQALTILEQLETVESLARTVFALRDLLPSDGSANGQHPGAKAPRKATGATKGSSEAPARRRVVAKRPERPQGGRGRIGLQFVYTTLAHGELWNFSLPEQTIEIDVRHPTWLALDEQHGRRLAQADQRLIAFQRQLVIEILVALARSGAETDFETFRDEINQRLMMFVSLNLPGTRA